MSGYITTPQFAFDGLTAAECIKLSHPGCRVQSCWTRNEHGKFLAATLLPCVAVVDCCFWTRHAAADQPSWVSWLMGARLVELKASRRHGLDRCTAAQDQQAGSNVRDEASSILWKIAALPHRHGIRSFEALDVARGCVKGNEGSWLLSDLGRVLSQSSNAK